MFAVYPNVASSGTVQNAVSAAPTAPTADRDRERPHRALEQPDDHAPRSPRRCRRRCGTSRLPRAAPPRARSGAGTAALNASAPRKNKPNASASVNEYSPASALTIGPPMIRWLNWIVASWLPADALTPLKKRNSVAVTAKSSGPGRRTLSPRPRAYALAGSEDGAERGDELERHVVGQERGPGTRRAAPGSGSRTARPGSPRTSPATSPRPASAAAGGPAGTPGTRRGHPCPRRWRSCSAAATGGSAAGTPPGTQATTIRIPSSRQSSRRSPVLGRKYGVGRRRNLRARCRVGSGIGRERLRRQLAHRHALSMAAAPPCVPGADGPQPKNRRRAPHRSTTGGRPPEIFKIEGSPGWAPLSDEVSRAGGASA